MGFWHRTIQLIIENIKLFACRSEFQQALLAHQSLNISQSSNTQTPPSSSALRMVFIASAIPFVGFGFLDNFIMVSLPTCMT